MLKGLIYLVTQDYFKAVEVAEILKQSGWAVIYDLAGKSRKKQLREADRRGAAYAVILED